jgi:hypothetical protein
MQQPSTGELLRGLRKSLASAVLPSLPKGIAQQQLKAALHLIGRLERTWDLAASHLAQDNADIETVLTGLLPASGDGSLQDRLERIETAQPGGYNDPALCADALRNLALHHVLEEMPATAELLSLYARMTARDAIYVGDTKKESDGSK